MLVDDYLPVSTLGHAKQMHELALEFTKNKHSVTILTPGKKNQIQYLECSTYEGINIWKFRSPPTRSKSKFIRTIREVLLPLRAIQALRTIEISRNMDICIYWSPTIFFGPVAYWFKRNKASTYLILRDFFPQWAIDSGMLSKNSPITYFFRLFEYITYKNADVIGVQSPANIEVFNKNIPFKHKNIEVLFNWASKRSSKVPSDYGKALFQKYKISDKIIIFYGGNIGHAQDMDNIMRLARNLLPEDSVHFLLVGQGDEFDLVKKRKKDWRLKNLTLLASVTQEEYVSILNNVSVGLFSLSESHVSHNIPGKLLGYIQANLPILGSVNKGNDVIELLSSAGVGLVSINGDDQKFLENAKYLISSSDIRKEMGLSGNKLLEGAFSVVKAAKKILEATKIKTN